jgi:hypothetical protein
VVVEGPTGSGKSTTVRLALAHLHHPRLCVTMLHGHLYATSSDACLLQMLQSLGVDMKGKRTAPEHELRVLVQRALAMVTREGAFTVVCLEQCELFAKQPRQPLLYFLNDLSHDPGVRLKLVLVTQGKGFEEALEKRISSRLSRTRLPMSPLNVDSAVTIVLDTLIQRGVCGPAIGRMESGGLRECLELLLRFNCTDARLLQKYCWYLLAREGRVREALECVLQDQWVQRLHSLSEVEMCVVVAMVVKGKSDVHIAYGDYAKEMRAENYPVVDKRLFCRAHRSLLASGAMEAPPNIVRDVLRRDETSDVSRWPFYLNRWGGTWLA